MIRPILFNIDMERVANNMSPIIVKFLIESGVTVCLLSIIIAIYAYVKKKSNLKTIRMYFIITFSRVVEQLKDYAIEFELFG